MGVCCHDHRVRFLVKVTQVKALTGGLARWDVGPRELLSAGQDRQLAGQSVRRLPLDFTAAAT